ncbi:MAG TPA: K(+)-transporting ATPase subunit F [Vicinamibacterales bacterium]|jgi:K+-transporting ATPase KdpF subunit|nr:K(+)-transporting ATPase subunit F [Vicinamibacterales bacterium]HVZ23016.1 K(+)-transporting ATPase subunit F [Vicinamibacterales bacterium]
MGMDSAIGVIVSLVMLAYLMVAMLRPEKF